LSEVCAMTLIPVRKKVIRSEKENPLLTIVLISGSV
jgi:hypothetical protein